MKNRTKAIIAIMLVIAIMFTFAVSTFAASKNVSKYHNGGQYTKYSLTFSNPAWYQWQKGDTVKITNTGSKTIYCVVGGWFKWVYPGCTGTWTFTTNRWNRTKGITVQAVSGRGYYSYRINTSSGTLR